MLKNVYFFSTTKNECRSETTASISNKRISSNSELVQKICKTVLEMLMPLFYFTLPSKVTELWIKYAKKHNIINIYIFLSIGFMQKIQNKQKTKSI